MEESKEEFISKFCNDHNGDIRFLRGIFYSEKDGSEEILAHLKTSQQNLLNAIKEEAKLERAGFFNKKYELEEKFTNGYNQAMNDFINIISK